MELTVEEAAMATALCFIIPGIHLYLSEKQQNSQLFLIDYFGEISLMQANLNFQHKDVTLEWLLIQNNYARTGENHLFSHNYFVKIVLQFFI